MGRTGGRADGTEDERPLLVEVGVFLLRASSRRLVLEEEEEEEEAAAAAARVIGMVLEEVWI